MKKALIIILTVGALFAQTKVRIISGATNTELKLLPDGTVYVSNTSSAALKLSQTNGAGALIVSNTSTAQIKIMPTNSESTWLYVSNVGPTVLTASNIVVNQNVTNTVSVNTVASIPLIVSNILLSSQSGVWQIIVSNGVTLADNKVNVTNGVPVSSLPVVNVIITNQTIGLAVRDTNQTYDVNGRLKGQSSIVSSNGNSFLSIQEGGIMSVSYEHSMVHIGDTYRTCQYFPQVANNGSAIMTLYSSNVWNHMTASVASAGQCVVYFWEFPLTNWFSVAGTNMVPMNMSRSSANTSSSVAKVSPTITNWAAGSVLCTSFMNGGTGNGSIGSEIRLDTEWNFQTNKVYVIQVSNTAGSAKDMSINQQWYEKDFFAH